MLLYAVTIYEIVYGRRINIYAAVLHCLAINNCLV
jgi:hypothetical protein